MEAAKVLKLSDQDELIEILISSVKLVFNAAFGFDVKVISSKSVPSPMTTGDLSGVMGLVQNFQEGNLVLSFPKETLSLAIAKIYGREFPEVDNSMIEAAAEITNMVYGQFKKEMNCKGHNLQMALPSMVTSKDHKIYQTGSCEGHFLRFAMDENHFFSSTVSFVNRF